MEEIMKLLKLKQIRFREKYAEGEVPHELKQVGTNTINNEFSLC
jgi:hypothetical protein